MSLIELVMVLAIIGVLAAIAAPRYGAAVSRYRAELAARRIAADLAFARDHARLTSASRTVVFDTWSSRYRLIGVPDLKQPNRTYTVHLQDLAHAAELVSVAFGGDHRVVFNGFGVPDSGGTVVVQSGSARRAVVLNPSTGEASIK